MGLIFGRNSRTEHARIDGDAGQFPFHPYSKVGETPTLLDQRTSTHDTPDKRNAKLCPGCVASLG